MAVDLAHSGRPLLHIRPIFIRQPKNLGFREDESATEQVLGIPGTGTEMFGHRMEYVIWGRRVRAGGSLETIMA